MEKIEQVTERRAGATVPVKHLYRRLTRKSDAEPWRFVALYGKLVDWQGVRRCFPLGTDEKAAREALMIIEARNLRREDFDADRVKPQKRLTIAQWSEQYFELEEVKAKRTDDRRLLPGLLRHLGKLPLSEFDREDLFRFVNDRRQDPIIRRGKPSKEHRVGLGQVRNELGLLSKMRNMALDKGIKASSVSFRGIVAKVKGRARQLSEAEEARLFQAMPTWLYRLAVWSVDSTLSECDLLRLNDDMISEELGVIEPTGGRKKTGTAQSAPLTPRMRQILSDLRAERRQRKVANVKGHGLLFTREDGSPITKSQIAGAMGRATAKAGIKDFHFHDLRHTCLTRWARRGIPVEHAMLAAGHASADMHNHYVHLRGHDIAKTFGTAKNVNDMYTSAGSQTAKLQARENAR
jgi:integrase